ncbi:MAG: peptidoglycan DD-metalloendopeptidase family protein [Psychroflexus sp.]|nr:peptidoglycan DD-metalloendopeptidase family protein [Psychroflexus sp.]MDR9449193.1 peptidoglycan DD-metalloendopeptidase family protein [Psychroflexus sp.]
MKVLGSVYLLMIIILMSCSSDQEPVQKNTKPVEQAQHKVIEKKSPVKLYGFDKDKYKVVQDTVTYGDFFGKIMDKHHVSPQKVYKITRQIPDTIFDARRINVGNAYTILKSKDSLQKPEVFIYEHDLAHYSKIFLGDSIYAEREEKPIEIRQRTATGTINYSLAEAIEEADMDYALTNRMANIYQWTIDFFKLQKGDRFKIIFNEKYIDDTIYAGIKNVDAVFFEHRGRDFYAFEFMTDSTLQRTEYFDEDADNLRKFFLKAPLNYSRISSRYQKRRYHPVQKRVKAHKGTDYAAARGTPIWGTADGVVIKSSYTSGNGKYVKIRHTRKYTTQYLHMSRRAVKTGQYVKQGEIIGYVGSTGLATGPHVCYRFWVNGRQVDPYKQNLPEAEPMADSLRDRYFEFITPLQKRLDSIKYNREVTNLAQL